MLQTLSFISVFHEARERGLRLNNFFQLADGSFRANWRLDGDKTWFGAFAEHERPFDALLNAYVLADLTAPGATRGIDPGLREHVATQSAAPIPLGGQHRLVEATSGEDLFG